MKTSSILKFESVFISNNFKMQIEIAFMMLGVFIGIFLHIVYNHVTRTAGGKKQSKQINRLADSSLPPEDEWEDESESGDEDYVRN